MGRWKGLHSSPRSLLEHLLKFVHWMYKQGPVVSRKLRPSQGDIQHFSAGILNFSEGKGVRDGWDTVSAFCHGFLWKAWSLIITWHKRSLPPILAQSTTVYISPFFIHYRYDITQHVPTCTLEKTRNMPLLWFYHPSSPTRWGSVPMAAMAACSWMHSSLAHVVAAQALTSKCLREVGPKNQLK